MGLIETRSPSSDPYDVALPPASTYRLFQCHCCLLAVDLCSRCDRGNIYCRTCAPVCVAERISRARRAYRNSTKGKKVRAAAEKRRRERRRLKPIENFVGDRGSPTAGDQGNTSSSEPVGSDNGVPVHEDPIIPSSPVDHFGLPPAPQGFIRCAHCHGLCKSFQIQGARARGLWRRPRSRALPHAPSNGGGAP